MIERIKFVDIAKGFCILFVVIGHYNPIEAPDLYHTFVDFLYTFHMPVFMCLSGFLFYKGFDKKKSYKNFIWGKMKRLLIPYFFLSVVIISIKLIVQNVITIENPIEYSSFLKIFIYPEAAFFLWFMYALFIIFLIVPLFLKYMKYGLEILLILSVSFYIVVGDELLSHYFCIVQVKRMLVFFILGCLLNKYFVKISLKSYCICACVIIHIGCFFALKIFCEEGWCERTMSLFMGILGCCSIVLLSNEILKFKYSSKIFYLGTMSNSIYLFHTMSMAPIKYFWHRFLGQNNDFSFIVGACIVISIGIFIPIVLKKIINKNRVLTKLVFGE